MSLVKYQYSKTSKIQTLIFGNTYIWDLLNSENSSYIHRPILAKLFSVKLPTTPYCALLQQRSVCLSLSLSLSLSVCPSLSASLYLYVYLSVCLSLSLCLSPCLSVCLSVSLSLALSLSLSLPLSLIVSLSRSLFLSQPVDWINERVQGYKLMLYSP